MVPGGDHLSHTSRNVLGLALFERVLISLTAIGRRVQPHEGAHNSEWATAEKNLTP